MGGFYGSVQVRATDRDRVRSELERIAATPMRFLLGPPLNGWVGIYPEGGGQDFGVARDLARRLGGELIALLVHDDDIFAYEYHRDGECADRYSSIPDYHGDVAEEEKRQLAGRPEKFAHLAEDRDRFAAISKRLAAQAEGREVFASDLLEAFAAALGIRNAVTSYEYLKENEETDDIEGWGRFVHVPDLTAEKARQKAARAAIVRAKKLLTKQGKLLAEHGGHKGWAVPSPWWCPAPDERGFLVAWSSHADPRAQRLPLELHGAPWSAGPRATSWAIGPRVYGMELSPSGRYLAVAHAAGDWKASLWDLEADRPLAEVPQVHHAMSSVGFLAGESAMFSVSSHGDEGRVAITPVGPGESRSFDLGGASLAAAHPIEPRLVVADDQNRLKIIDVATGEVVRTTDIGGRYRPTALETQFATNFQASLVATDPDVLDEQGREQLDARLDEYARKSIAKGETLESARRRLEEMLAKMREGFAAQAAALANRGAEKPFRLRFDRDGKWLFLATSAGARAYAWKRVLEADDPRPAFSVDVAPTVMESDDGERRREGYVYDLDHDWRGNRLLFAGLEGRVRYLDLDSGATGVLLDPPGLPPINRLALARDGSTLALTCLPDLHTRNNKRRGPVLQFWDYGALVPQSAPQSRLTPPT